MGFVCVTSHRIYLLGILGKKKAGHVTSLDIPDGLINTYMYIYRYATKPHKRMLVCVLNEDPRE